jgi:hypothetical protein
MYLIRHCVLMKLCHLTLYVYPGAAYRGKFEALFSWGSRSADARLRNLEPRREGALEFEGLERNLGASAGSRGGTWLTKSMSTPNHRPPQEAPSQAATLGGPRAAPG